VRNVTLYYGNLETFDLSALGKFDAVWCVGIIYHLPEPWSLVKSISDVTNLVYGWSHLAAKSVPCREGYCGERYQEVPEGSRLSGMSSYSWWVTPADFERMWRDVGYTHFEWLTLPAPHPNGSLAAQFIVSRPETLLYQHWKE
jgi:SAM-dependent methyltransferase